MQIICSHETFYLFSPLLVFFRSKAYGNDKYNLYAEES